MIKPQAILLCSGGLNSVTLAYQLQLDYALTLVSFNYGQAHAVELLYARLCGTALNVPHIALNARFLGKVLPDHTNHLMIMVSIGAGIAVNQGAKKLAIASERNRRPEARNEMMGFLQAALLSAHDLRDFEVYTPYLNKTKADIVRLGREYGVPFENTWDCLVSGDLHCGQCEGCRERQRAFSEAKVVDVTGYEHAG